MTSARHAATVAPSSRTLSTSEPDEGVGYGGLIECHETRHHGGGHEQGRHGRTAELLTQRG